MVKEIIRSIKNLDYIDFLKSELDIIRKERDDQITVLTQEKIELQNILHKVLRINSVPVLPDQNIPSSIPESKLATRNFRRFLNDKQKSSWGELQDKIAQVEQQNAKV